MLDINKLLGVSKKKTAPLPISRLNYPHNSLLKGVATPPSKVSSGFPKMNFPKMNFGMSKMKLPNMNMGLPKSKDWDGDGVPNWKDCQPRNVMRQDFTPFKWRDASKLSAAKRFGGKNLSRLKQIGYGRDRQVYALDKDKVLKIAKNPGGLTQNTMESDLESLRLKHYETGLDYVVMERAAPPGKATTKMIKHLKDARYDSIRAVPHDVLSKTEERIGFFSSPHFEKSGLDETDYSSYEISPSEFLAKRQWGEKGGRPVLVDAGALMSGPDLYRHRIKDFQQVADIDKDKAPPWQLEEWKEVQRQRKIYGDNSQIYGGEEKPEYPKGQPLPPESYQMFEDPDGDGKINAWDNDPDVPDNDWDGIGDDDDCDEDNTMRQDSGKPSPLWEQRKTVPHWLLNQLDKEEKKEAIKLLKQDVSVSAIADRYNVKNPFSVPQKSRVFLTREQKIQSLQDFYKEYGRTPTGEEITEIPSLPGKTAYAKEFGTWNKALIAAGLPVVRAIKGVKKVVEIEEQLGKVPTAQERRVEYVHRPETIIKSRERVRKYMSSEKGKRVLKKRLEDPEVRKRNVGYTLKWQEKNREKHLANEYIKNLQRQAIKDIEKDVVEDVAQNLTSEQDEIPMVYTKENVQSLLQEAEPLPYSLARQKQLARTKKWMRELATNNPTAFTENKNKAQQWTPDNKEDERYKADLMEYYNELNTTIQNQTPVVQQPVVQQPVVQQSMRPVVIQDTEEDLAAMDEQQEQLSYDQENWRRDEERNYDMDEHQKAIEDFEPEPEPEEEKKGIFGKVKEWVSDKFGKEEEEDK